MSTQFQQIKKRTLLMSAAFILFWGLVVGRLFSIQVINSDQYQATCKHQADYRKTITPIRGAIFDRNQKALTVDIVQYNIAIHPYLLDDKVNLAKELSILLRPNYSKYLKALKSDRTYIVLERNLPHNEIQAFLDKYQYHNGFAVERRIQRNYPFGELTGQLIGFTDTDNHGIVGMEKELEPYLCGSPGWQITLKDGWGRLNNRPDLPYQESTDGNDITLTIDYEYQTILYEELMNAFTNHDADKAMGIIINPQNGEILGMATIPGFDPNNPMNYPVSSQINRVVTDIFEPGSTFKIITATAAFDRNRIQPGDIIDCENGHISVGKHIIHDHKKYNQLSFAEVIKKSSNVGTIKVAQKIGRDEVFNYARRYGFGMKTDIQFPGEQEGIIHPLKEWGELALAQAAIGHGICVTALQLAYAYAAIANGGYLIKPQLVKSIQTKDGITLYENKSQYIRRVASSETMQTMRELLRLTVQSGTGLKAEINGMAIAGKTGTAQKVTETGYSQTDYVATFVGFFPANNPKLLCVIVVDNPKGIEHTGGNVSAPILRDVFARIVNLSDDLFFPEDRFQAPDINIAEYNSEKQKPSYRTVTTAPNNSRVQLSSYQYSKQMPDLKGKTLRQAIAILQTLGVDPDINGNGVVVSQYPPKNTIISTNTDCRIVLQPREIQFD
ncbi:MAG: penicillin-binding protein [bacterium]